MPSVDLTHDQGLKLAGVVGRPPVRAALILGGCVLFLIGVLVADVDTPGDFSPGAAGVLPILISTILLAPRPARAVVVLAVISRFAVAVAAGTTYETAVFEVCAYVATAALATAAIRRSPAPASPVPATPAARPDTTPPGLPRLEMLSGREREVVTLALRAYTAREIGTRLFISERTVESHLANAYPKLGVSSRRELIRLFGHRAA